ncbi:MAG: type II toxin-antitoxin system RelE/ParE family toxin [Thermomicrobiales bacterium]
MSVPRLQLVLTRRAGRDIRDIRGHTLKYWGEDQDAVYYVALRNALDVLRDQPDLGRPRDDLRPGMRSHRVHRHAVYYVTEGDRIIVLRILHQRMDLGPDDFAQTWSST